MANKVFIDLESTGKDPLYHEPLEIGVIITTQKLEIIKKCVFKCKPLNFDNWQEEAEEKHKISLGTAVFYPHPLETCNRILEMFEEFSDGEIYEWVDHSRAFYNSGGYDFPLFENMFRNQGLSMKLNRYVSINKRESTINIAIKKGYKKNDLKTWSKRIGFELDHHNVMSDTMCCFYLYKFFKSGKRYTEQGENLCLI